MKPPPTSPAVPQALSGLVEHWRATASTPQAPVPWPRERWAQFFPSAGTFWKGLPDHLDREVVRQACQDAGRDPASARRGFLATMAWGYARVGYGPWRTARILRETPNAEGRLVSVARTLAAEGAPAAYRQLADNQRLVWLGPAFGTKYLYFCPQPADGPRALILDRLVADWLGQHTPLRLNPLSWSPRVYDRYLHQLGHWSAALDVEPEHLEELIFRARSVEVGNQWA